MTIEQSLESIAISLAQQNRQPTIRPTYTDDMVAKKINEIKNYLRVSTIAPDTPLDQFEKMYCNILKPDQG